MTKLLFKIVGLLNKDLKIVVFNKKRLPEVGDTITVGDKIAVFTERQ